MNGPDELDPIRAAELIGREGTQLVDVRTPEEHAAARIAGDVHIELEALPAEAGTLDRGQPLVFYCRSGARSALATEAFRSAGFDAYNLDGGVLAWIKAGLPIEPRDGSVD